MEFFLIGRSATRSNRIYFYESSITTAPTGLSIATVNIISHTMVIYEGTDYTDYTAVPPTMIALCDSFWILKKSTINANYNLQWVTDGLKNGTLREVCDVSYKPKLNEKGITTAWIFENESSTHNIRGTIGTCGITLDSYQCELLGIYAILSAISYIERYNKSFTTRSIKIGCDNKKSD